jgi:NCAIR mutase (PurE)-related protein
MAGLDELLRGFADLGFARVDTDREARQGAPEGIVAEGKTPEEIEAIARALLDEGAGSVMVTRADEAARAALARVAPDAEQDARARLAWVARSVPEVRGLVTVVSGGTSDGPVVAEARVRASLLGPRSSCTRTRRGGLRNSLPRWRTCAGRLVIVVTG